MPTTPRRLTTAALSALVLAPGACGPLETRSQVDARFNGRADADVRADVGAHLDHQLAARAQLEHSFGGTLKVDGPLTIQVQGPVVKYEGTYISDELFEEVKVGMGDDWIVAVMGPPDVRAPLRDGTEIWRWTYRPTMQQGPVVEVFDKREKEPKLATRTVFLQMKDGVVVRKWKG